MREHLSFFSFLCSNLSKGIVTMTFEETLQYIESLSVFGMKLGLERLSILLKKMGDPQKKLRFIHVAGTNGKGSTAAMVANILRYAGYKTGLYISPYVINIRERMQVDNRLISEQELAECATYVRGIAAEMQAEEESPTQFELETAIAFEWFYRSGCELVCLEVGLGGRFDATNIIDQPLVQVITAIGLDHTAVLGDTIEKIAFEKAGIIKGGVTVLYPIQEEGVRTVIRRKCEETHCNLIIPSLKKLTILDDDWLHMEFSYDGLVLKTSLPGRFQVYNSITAVEAVRQLVKLGYAISEKNIVYGIEHTVFPARMEVLLQKPLVLLDGAHNPSGARALAETLAQLKGRPITMMIGMLADKDCDETLRVLAPYASRIITVTPPNPRALPAKDLAKKAAPYCRVVQDAEDAVETVRLTLDTMQGEEALVICGSLYLASELRPALIEKIIQMRTPPRRPRAETAPQESEQEE